MIQFDHAQLSQEVKDVLQDAFPHATVRTDEGWHGRVHARIVSAAFNGKSEVEKQDMVWEVLRQRMQDQAQGVSLVLVYGEDEDYDEL